MEFENLKDMNLKLITQFHVEHSPANIEKMAKENLGMIKKDQKRLLMKKKNKFFNWRFFTIAITVQFLIRCKYRIFSIQVIDSAFLQMKALKDI